MLCSLLNNRSEVILTEEELENLTKLKVNSEVAQESCTICLEPFVQEECIRILACKHSYHKKCVDFWLLNFREVCPLCGKSINNENAENSNVLNVI
ncbi:zinc finger: C3HC4 type-like protein [Leptotrombidium deliense]|uniref:Zinc finger: C3HC4 type-like protein n=1 Tax=Leptotrombidium deliense TaxID=299467 RepID=A0A443S5D2_9ACAR|nr:zinc finger: C3HC4 type-like protein [Leptotrombidium deliense]